MPDFQAKTGPSPMTTTSTEWYPGIEISRHDPLTASVTIAQRFSQFARQNIMSPPNVDEMANTREQDETLVAYDKLIWLRPAQTWLESFFQQLFASLPLPAAAKLVSLLGQQIASSSEEGTKIDYQSLLGFLHFCKLQSFAVVPVISFSSDGKVTALWERHDESLALKFDQPDLIRYHVLRFEKGTRQIAIRDGGSGKVNGFLAWMKGHALFASLGART